MKYLSTHLRKHRQDLYGKDHKMMKNAKEASIFREIYHVHEVNTVKMLFLSNLIYGFNAIPTKILVRFLVDINKLILKYTWKGTGCRLAKMILAKKSKLGRITLPNIKASYSYSN